MVLPPLGVCLQRVRDRSDHPFADQTAATDMWHSFATTQGSLATVDTLGTPDKVAAEIVRLVRTGTLLTAR